MALHTGARSTEIDEAADALIEALEGTGALTGFRDGLRRTIAYTEAVADPSCAEHAEALSAVSVWRALDELAAAVEQRHEEVSP